MRNSIFYPILVLFLIVSALAAWDIRQGEEDIVMEVAILALNAVIILVMIYIKFFGNKRGDN